MFIGLRGNGYKFGDGLDIKKIFFSGDLEEVKRVGNE